MQLEEILLSKSWSGGGGDKRPSLCDRLNDQSVGVVQCKVETECINFGVIILQLADAEQNGPKY